MGIQRYTLTLSFPATWENGNIPTAIEVVKQTLYNLRPLGKRDSAANNMLNAFDLYTARK